MRTNIVIDNNLMREVQKVTGIKTKKEAVENGLHMLINVYKQQELLKYKGKIHLYLNLNESRKSRI